MSLDFRIFGLYLLLCRLFVPRDGENGKRYWCKQKLDLKFGTFEKSPYICTEYIENVMETTALNPTQMHLLKLFAFNNSEEYAREIQEVLTRHFQSRLDAEADRLWDEGILNQEKLDEIRKMNLHAK